MEILENLKVKIYADGASVESINKLSQHDWINGFTTNPSLMRSEGLKTMSAIA